MEMNGSHHLIRLFKKRDFPIGSLFSENMDSRKKNLVVVSGLPGLMFEQHSWKLFTVHIDVL